ncbi:ABC transporter permease [Streptomyces sp. H39-S7]|uniref:ABC transporter permease n=1 Tax=Streptomyces sp. H39-S7 TaxID=3004357 RepID=UPI0022AF22C8|nr:ABC transporter permease [Streptomyces sp. H39-S7]MCZ4119668.1 ABC transporter permease [Streptomyces sp. H39-S7]
MPPLVTRLAAHRLFWPLALLAALLVTNVVYTPDFFSIQIRDGHLFGSLIDILRLGSPLLLVALGMTLVIAIGGIDLSVGAVVAISGAVACLNISDLADQHSAGGVVVAVLIALGVCIALGVWNGVLVAGIGMQPIIATLILMVAGRGVAQMITSGRIITVNSEPYHLIGGGYELGLPLSVLIAAAVLVLTGLVVRRTALGLLLESVGGNKEASRLVGIRARGLTIAVYAFCALCAAGAGLMISSNVAAADGNNAGLWIELDAILAVVIGGTSLTGGRFHLGGTAIGALVIQTLSTTVYTVGVPPETTLVFKALVVMAVCLLQSPAFRAKVLSRKAPRRPGTAGGARADATAQRPGAPRDHAPANDAQSPKEATAL